MKSSQGLLYLDKTSGQIDTSAQLMLSGKTLQLDGVITTQEGESSDGYQLILSADDITQSGAMDLTGSVKFIDIEHHIFTYLDALPNAQD